MLQAGFRPGRRVRVSVEYIDAREVREAEYQRLTAILDQYPLPPELQGMTEEDALALADEAISEVRQGRMKKIGPPSPYLFNARQAISRRQKPSGQRIKSTA
jgi:hypothetical protein